MITHRQLEHALILARIGNFSRAATEANLSQSAFSRSIRNLEDYLGVALFDRSATQVSPTRYGETLISQAQTIVADVRELRRDIRQMTELTSGEFSAGLGVYPAEIYGNLAIAHMVRDYPGLTYRVFVSNWEDITNRVLSRDVDIGFVAKEGTLYDRQLDFTPVCGHRMYVYARSGHPLAGKRHLTKEDLDQFPLVSIRVPAAIAPVIPGQASIDPVSGVLIPSIEVDDMSTARSIISHCDGVGVAVPMQIEGALESGDFVLLDFPTDNLNPMFYFVTPKGRTISPAAEKFIRRVRSLDEEAEEKNQMIYARYTT